MESKQIKILGIAQQQDSETLQNITNCAVINCMAVMEADEDSISKAISYPIDTLVMYTDAFDADEEQFIDKFFSARKGVAGILIINGEKTLDVVERAMSCGFAKVVSAEAGPEDVCDAIIEETERQQSRTETAQIRKYDSRVIAVYSPKGGVGKTTISVNLAAGLKARGKRVTILDMDLAFGDINSMIDSVSKGDTLAELADEAVLTPKVIKSYIRKTDIGVDIICAPGAPELADQITPRLVAQVIETLRAENDFVVIDCFQTISPNTRMVFEESDCIILVVNPEYPTLKSAAVSLDKIFCKKTLTPKVKLVINKLGSSTLKEEDIARELETEVFATIPFDTTTVVNSANAGVPFMSEAPGKKLFKKKIITAFDKFTDKIIEDD